MLFNIRQGGYGYFAVEQSGAGTEGVYGSFECRSGGKYVIHNEKMNLFLLMFCMWFRDAKGCLKARYAILSVKQSQNSGYPVVPAFWPESSNHIQSSVLPVFARLCGSNMHTFYVGTAHLYFSSRQIIYSFRYAARNLCCLVVSPFKPSQQVKWNRNYFVGKQGIITLTTLCNLVP